MEIWWKSLSMSFGGYIFDTRLIEACLFNSGYLHYAMLAYTMLCTTGASSSQNRFSNQVGILSAPVTFRVLRCPSIFLTYLTGGADGGRSFSTSATVLIFGTSVGSAFSQGLVNTRCNRAAKSVVSCTDRHLP